MEYSQPPTQQREDLQDLLDQIGRKGIVSRRRCHVEKNSLTSREII